MILNEMQANNDKKLDTFDLPQMILLPILSSLLAQALRYAVPYLKKRTQNLIFSQKQEIAANVDNQAKLLDNNRENDFVSIRILAHV
jgi:hypothetical protein